jgi:hypothetical protein
MVGDAEDCHSKKGIAIPEAYVFLLSFPRFDFTLIISCFFSICCV